MGLTDKQRNILVALGDTLLPSLEDGDPSGGEVLPEAFDEFLPTLEEDKQKELGVALSLFDFVAIFGNGRRFTSLSEARRARYVEAWMRSRIKTRRIIFRALRELCMLLYYQDRRTWHLVNYEGPPIERAS